MRARVTKFRFNDVQIDAEQRAAKIDEANAKTREALRLLREAGAHNAANYLARARKSLAGAHRHALRFTPILPKGGQTQRSVQS